MVIYCKENFQFFFFNYLLKFQKSLILPLDWSNKRDKTKMNNFEESNQLFIFFYRLICPFIWSKSEDIQPEYWFLIFQIIWNGMAVNYMRLIKKQVRHAH